MNNRVVITGMGAVTPIGIGVDVFWDNIVKGTCGISDIEKINTDDLQIHKAGEIKGFNAKEYLPTKLAMDLEPYMQYAYIAAEEAISQSGLDVAGENCGVVMGSALNGIDIIGKTERDFVVKERTASPKFLVKAMGNIAAAQLAINHGIKGPSMTVSTACSSGGDAIKLADMMIKAGEADAMVVMAGEDAITDTLIQCLTKTGALSKTGESKPFDKSRNGFVLGAGGGAVILESLEHAQKRGAVIIAELLGAANNNDAFNPVSPEPEGEGAIRCMKTALKNAGIDAADVDYINAHGTSTAIGDVAETKAIKNVFGKRDVFVSSTKGATGHMMGAGGITEVISCIKAIETGILPVNVGMVEQDEECDLNIVTAEKCRQHIKVAMSNALGFGGQNSSVIVGKYE